jgi:hypothetical protein
MLYIIESISEQDSETNRPLYWNNQYGWVDRDNADIFTEEEIEKFTLPIDGTWVAAIDEANEEDFA